MFNKVMELASIKYILRKLLDAANLARVAESKPEMQEVLEWWKEAF